MPNLLVLEVPSTSLAAPPWPPVLRVLIHVVPPFFSPLPSSPCEGGDAGGGGLGSLASGEVQEAQCTLLQAPTPGPSRLRSSYCSDQRGGEHEVAFLGFYSWVLLPQHLPLLFQSTPQALVEVLGGRVLAQYARELCHKNKQKHTSEPGEVSHVCNSSGQVVKASGPWAPHAFVPSTEGRGRRISDFLVYTASSRPARAAQ